jgi:hypothetical protein
MEVGFWVEVPVMMILYRNLPDQPLSLFPAQSILGKIAMGHHAKIAMGVWVVIR